MSETIIAILGIVMPLIQQLGKIAVDALTENSHDAIMASLQQALQMARDATNTLAGKLAQNDAAADAANKDP